MNSNILKQEIDYLKQILVHRDKTIKQKDSQSYKLQTEMSALKKRTINIVEHMQSSLKTTFVMLNTL